MQKLSPGSTPSSMEPSNSTLTPQPVAAMYAGQLSGFYPQANLTMEFLAGVTGLFMWHTEKVLKEVCNPVHGIPGYHKFFPSLAELKAFCETVAERQERHSRPAIPLQAINRNPPEEAPIAFYEGPIEGVRPGDRIHSSRLEEYEAFIRTKGVVPRRWGYNESYVDSGARPFELPANPVPPEPAQSPQSPQAPSPP